MTGKSYSAVSEATQKYIEDIKNVNHRCKLMNAQDINERWPQFHFGDNVFGNQT